MEAGVLVVALEVEVDKGTVAGGERRHILRAGEDMEVASKEMATALVEASTQAVEVEAMGVRDLCQMNLPSQRLLATFLPTLSRVTWTQFSKT